MEYKYKNGKPVRGTMIKIRNRFLDGKMVGIFFEFEDEDGNRFEVEKSRLGGL